MGQSASNQLCGWTYQGADNAPFQSCLGLTAE